MTGEIEKAALLNERASKVAEYARTMADKYLFARLKLAILQPLLSDDITKLCNGRMVPTHTTRLRLRFLWTS